jgi:hypothetical protein
VLQKQGKYPELDYTNMLEIFIEGGGKKDHEEELTGIAEA